MFKVINHPRIGLCVTARGVYEQLGRKRTFEVWFDTLAREGKFNQDEHGHWYTGELVIEWNAMLRILKNMKTAKSALVAAKIRNALPTEVADKHLVDKANEAIQEAIMSEREVVASYPAQKVVRPKEVPVANCRLRKIHVKTSKKGPDYSGYMRLYGCWFKVLQWHWPDGNITQQVFPMTEEQSMNHEAKWQQDNAPIEVPKKKEIPMVSMSHQAYRELGIQDEFNDMRGLPF